MARTSTNFAVAIRSISSFKCVCQHISVLDANRDLRWKIVQGGFWANGKASLRDDLVDIERSTMEDRAEALRCPTLLTAAEKAPLAKGAQTLFDALRCKKQLVKFAAAERAGDHCETMNRSAVNRVALDGLDEVLIRASSGQGPVGALDRNSHAQIVPSGEQSSICHPFALSKPTPTHLA